MADLNLPVIVAVIILWLFLGLPFYLRAGAPATNQGQGMRVTKEFAKHRKWIRRWGYFGPFAWLAIALGKKSPLKD